MLREMSDPCCPQRFVPRAVEKREFVVALLSSHGQIQNQMFSASAYIQLWLRRLGLRTTLDGVAAEVKYGCFIGIQREAGMESKPQSGGRKQNRERASESNSPPILQSFSKEAEFPEACTARAKVV